MHITWRDEEKKMEKEDELDQRRSGRGFFGASSRISSSSRFFPIITSFVALC
jgi:hypothetical protein